jgi:hypothetical protein
MKAEATGDMISLIGCDWQQTEKKGPAEIL